MIEGLGYYVYENTNALPKTFLVHEAKWIEGRVEQIAAMKEPEFNPGRMAILEGPAAPKSVEAEPASGATAGTPLAQDFARIAARTNNHLWIEMNSIAPGYLVMTEAFYPGWKAYVDGVPTKVLRADYAFKAVRVPSGAHRVELVFEPISFLVGGAGFVTAFVLAIGLLAADFGQSWRRLGVLADAFEAKARHSRRHRSGLSS